MEEADLPGAVEQTLAELDQQQRTAREALDEAFQELEGLYLEMERRAEQLSAERELAEPGESELDNMRRERDELNDQLSLLRERLEAMPEPCQEEDSEADAELHELQQLACPGAVPLRAPFEKLRNALK